MGAGSVGRYVTAMSCHGRWGAAFVPVALGTCAAWIRPALYALQNGESGLFIVSLGTAAAVLVYSFGREFEHFKTTIETAGITRATWVGLVGPSASGKTAAAWHLIGELRSSNPGLQVLVGHCTEGGPPFQPFREALTEIGISPGLMTSRGQGGDVNSIIERLADEFIPFWDFFSGAAEEGEDEDSTRAELLAAVTNGLAPGGRPPRRTLHRRSSMDR
jgi:hypothetical protein